jgi:MoaA/NifB/PqqE/SkfB family radical SAM enzyme
MLELTRHAASLDFSVSIVTNGFWGINQTRATAMIAALAQVGLRRLELSTDVFHQEYIPIKTVRSAIQVLKSAGVRVVLRVVTSRKHTVEETLRQLTLEDLDGLEVVGSPVIPVGRARHAVPHDELYLSAWGICGSCHTMLNLTVGPDGNVSPCCAGSENTPSLSLGNIRELPLDVIVRNAEWNFLVKKLVFEGPSSFLDQLRKAGLAHKVKSEYTNICHACSEFFGDPEVVQVARTWTATTEAASLAGLLLQLEGFSVTT